MVNKVSFIEAGKLHTLPLAISTNQPFIQSYFPSRIENALITSSSIDPYQAPRNFTVLIAAAFLLAERATTPQKISVLTSYFLRLHGRRMPELQFSSLKFGPVADTLLPNKRLRTNFGWISRDDSFGKWVTLPAVELNSYLSDLDSFFVLNNRCDTLYRAFALTAQFLSIHPLSDGNGRAIRSILIYLTICHESLAQGALALAMLKNKRNFLEKLVSWQHGDEISSESILSIAAGSLSKINAWQAERSKLTTNDKIDVFDLLVLSVAVHGSCEISSVANVTGFSTGAARKAINYSQANGDSEREILEKAKHSANSLINIFR